MLFKKTVFTMLFLMCTNLFSYGMAIMKVTKKDIYLKYGSSLLVDNRSLTSPGMVFGGCSENISSLNKRSCSFALETRKDPSSQDHLNFCNAVLKSDERAENIDNVREVITLGEDKAIIIWSNQYDLDRFSILHFSDCSIINAKIDDNIHIHEADIFTTYEDIFDIVVRNDGKSSCTHAKYCKLTIEDEGNMITDVIKWKYNELNEIVAFSHSPMKGYLIVDSNQDKTIVRVLAGDEVSSVIRVYLGDKNLPHTVSVSSTQKHLTICYQTNAWNQTQNSNGISKCSQFDSDGRLKFETTLNFIVGINSISIYNLPEGGFLLLIEACSLNRHHNCLIPLFENLLIVTKVNANGKVDGSIGISEFQLDRGLQLNQIHWFLSEQEEYCLSAVYKPKQEHSAVDLSILCFSDTDFAKSFEWLRN